MNRAKRLGTEAWAKAWRLPRGRKDHQQRKRRQKRREKQQWKKDEGA